MRRCARSSWSLRMMVVAGCVVSTPSRASAQLLADSAGAPARSIFARSDAWLGVGFVVATAVAMPNDRHFATEFQRAGVQESGALRNAASVFRAVGQPGVLVGAVSAWGLGRLTHRPQLAASGLRVTEAIVVAGVLTTAAKVVVGRARPATTNDRDPHDYRWWRGTESGYTSMPSGHTSAAFAAASALAGEWPTFAPGSARYAVPTLYAGATIVGLSRMYHDRHWGSDVVAGAALGTLVGRVVGRWGRANEDNRVQRWLAPVALQASGGPTGDVRIALAGWF